MNAEPFSIYSTLTSGFSWILFELIVSLRVQLVLNPKYINAIDSTEIHEIVNYEFLLLVLYRSLTFSDKQWFCCWINEFLLLNWRWWVKRVRGKAEQKKIRKEFSGWKGSRIALDRMWVYIYWFIIASGLEVKHAKNWACFEVMVEMRFLHERIILT